MKTWADVVKGAPTPPTSSPLHHYASKPSQKTPTVLRTQSTLTFTKSNDSSIQSHSRESLKDHVTPSNTPYNQEQINTTCTHFSDDPSKKLPNNFRFAFNNLNGLPLTSATLINFAAITKELQSDWTGIVETHIASDRSHVRDRVLSTLSSPQGFANVNAVFSSSDFNSDDDMKFGGILQFTTNNLASSTVSRHSNKYGRLVYQPNYHWSKRQTAHYHHSIPGHIQFSWHCICLRTTTRNAGYSWEKRRPKNRNDQRPHCLYSLLSK